MAITKIHCPKCGCEATFDSGGLIRSHDASTHDTVFDEDERKYKLVRFKWSCDGDGATVVITDHPSFCADDQTPQAG